MDREALQALRSFEQPEARRAAPAVRRSFRRPGPASLATLIIVIVGLAGTLAWRRQGEDAAAVAALPEDTAPVSTSAVSRPAGLPVPTLSASGYVIARRKATVSSRVVGKVAELHIEEGMAVAAGQVLARLDDGAVKAEEALAESQLAAARARKAEADVLLTQSRRHFERIDVLYRDGLASQSEFEQAQADLNSQSARAETAAREADVAVRQLAVVRNRLEEMVVRAPFTGIVISRDAQPGEIVSPSSGGGGFTRTGIGTIVDVSSIEAEVDVNEAFIDRVTPGQAAATILDAYPDWRIPSRVINIVPTANRQKATVRVRIALDEQDARILPDMSVQVHFY